MNGIMIHYYFFKKVVDNIDKSIMDRIDYSNDLLFNVANFNSTPAFYRLFNLFKGDKYGIYDYFKSPACNDFIIDCTISLQKNNDFNKLFLIYGMLSHKILNDYLYPFINVFKDNTYSFNTALNMLDYYYTKKDGINLTKVSICKLFPNSFTYYDYMDELIRYPIVKNFKLMSSKSYFLRCYKTKKKFYKKYAKVKYKKVLLRMWAFLFRKRVVKPNEYYYKDEIDIKLLNVKKVNYKIGENEYNDSLEELLKKALFDVVNKIKAINSYLIDNNDSKFRKEFKISPEKKL